MRTWPCKDLVSVWWIIHFYFLLFIIFKFYIIQVFNASSVDPDLNPCFRASDLDLHTFMSR